MKDQNCLCLIILEMVVVVVVDICDFGDNQITVHTLTVKQLIQKTVTTVTLLFLVTALYSKLLLCTIVGCFGKKQLPND